MMVRTRGHAGRTSPWRAAIRMPEDDRHDRRGQERQAGRAQGQQAERELRLDRRAALRRQRVEVLARLAGRALGVLEERDLGLVPAPGPATRRRRPSPGIDGRRAAPDGDVAALVVAVAGLRPDVRAGQADVDAGRARSGRPERRTSRSPALGVDRRLDGDADRIAVVVDPGRDLVRVGRELVEARRASRAGVRGVASAAVVASSRGLLADVGHDWGARRRRRRTSTGRAAA